MSFTITTEACSDIKADFAKANNIFSLNFEYILDGQSYFGGLEDNERGGEFFALLDKTDKASTSMINETTHYEFFKEILKKGEDILHIALSSNLSGTFSAAKSALNNLKSEFPDRKIFIVDSLNVSAGEGSLVHLAVKCRGEEKSIEETATFIQSMVPKVQLLLTVDSLTRFHKGGRLSSSQALLGGLLDIKPILKLNEEGRLVPFHKIRKRRKALEFLLTEMGKDYDGSKQVFIEHGDCIEEALNLKKEIQTRFNISEVIVNFVGPVVGCHSGRGVLGIIYFKK